MLLKLLQEVHSQEQHCWRDLCILCGGYSLLLLCLETFPNELQHFSRNPLYCVFPPFSAPSQYSLSNIFSQQSFQPHSVLIASLGFLTETGKTRASIILSTGTESSFQVTQIRIKVQVFLFFPNGRVELDYFFLSTEIFKFVVFWSFTFA